MKVIRTDILDFNQVWTIEFIKLSAAEISNSHLYIYSIFIHTIFIRAYDS